MTGDILSVDEILEGLKTTCLGRRIYAHDSLDSTNATAKALTKDGAPEGSLVIAEEQKRGRGRFGREWYSPKGLGLWFSLILRPEKDVEKLCSLSVLASVSLVQAIRASTALPVLARWPNDCVLQGRKLCGVLAEIDPPFVVLGIGINVNNSSFPAELPTATSLRKELGKPLSRVELLCQVLLQLERDYSLFLQHGGLEPLLGRAREFSSLVGERVSVSTGEGSVLGEVLGIDEEGRLLLRLSSGKIRPLIAGEVRQVR